MIDNIIAVLFGAGIVYLVRWIINYRESLKLTELERALEVKKMKHSDIPKLIIEVDTLQNLLETAEPSSVSWNMAVTSVIKQINDIHQGKVNG